MCMHMERSEALVSRHSGRRLAQTTGKPPREVRGTRLLACEQHVFVFAILYSHLLLLLLLLLLLVLALLRLGLLCLIGDLVFRGGSLP